MGKKAKHPEGAIVTRDELLALIEQAKSGTPVKVYSISLLKKRIMRRVLDKSCFITNEKLHYVNKDGHKRCVALAHRAIPSKRGVQIRGYIFTNFFLAMAYAARIGATEYEKQ